MQTNTRVHDTNQKQGNVMNNNPNRDSGYKEKQMNVIIKTLLVTVLVALGLPMTAWAAEPPKADDTQNGAMPFTVKVTKEELEVSPPYMGAKGQDFPFNAVKIEGEYWIFLHPTLSRWMGTNFVNTVKQPDGRRGGRFPVEGVYCLGGMWYDAAEKKLYAPLHCETHTHLSKVRRGPSPNPIREIHLASSTDKGLTWKYEGPLVTRTDEPAGADDFSGVCWDGGDGDFYLFVDERGGYIYLYSNHYTWGKRGAPVVFEGTLRHRVARCAIADKMAPGKWKKFYNGKWEEPGVGGRASYVDAYYVMYNTYLKKYISFNYGPGISVCTDMDKQDWSPSYQIQPFEAWGTTWGAWFGLGDVAVMNEDRTDTYTGGKTLYFYKYWMNHKTECYRLDLDNAPAKENYGYHPIGGCGRTGPATFSGPLSLHGEAPFYESPDPIESRRTRRLNRDSAEVSASPGWNKDRVSATAGSSLEFSFKAADVYWRATRGPGMGKADVYLDGALQTTVDTWAAGHTPHMFAYVRTGLDPAKTHTLKIVVRGEKNHRSTGTAIGHLSFEYSADTTRALYAFSAIQGKNQWRYQERLGGKLVDMKKYDNVGGRPHYAWVGEGGAMIGFDYLAVGSSEPVRTWTAHRAGTVRIEGTVTGKEPAAAAILHNGEQIWPKAGPAGAQANVHDLKIAVKEGDTISFVARIAAGDAPAPVTQPATPRDPKGGPPPTTLTWDPVLTYIES
jgi:hypothetical protein